MKSLVLVFFLAVGAVAQLRPDPETERQLENLNEQMRALTAQEATLNARLAQLKQQYSDTDPQVAALQRQIMGLESQIRIFSNRDAQLRRGTDRNSQQGTLQTALVKAQLELQATAAREAAAESQLSQLRLRYTETHPDVVALKNQLAELKAREAAARAQIATATVELDRDNAQGASLNVPIRERWWRRASTVQSLGLTFDQQKKMDDVFQQFRVKLIDANAALQKAEAMLDPLVSAQSLDDARITAQIDRVAEARAELEKTNGRMLLGIRKLLTPAQWTKLNAAEPALGGESVLEQRLK